MKSLSNQSLKSKLKQFDSYLKNAQADWRIPGMAVSLIKDHRVIFKKCYGVREYGKKEKVNQNTLFACASITKAMTVTCMGILIDEGKVKWDDPVHKYLPEYQLYDPVVSRELKIRDLFTHNTGLGNTDFLWLFMDIPAKETLNRIRLVKPAYSLRSSFIYQNFFYVAAGQVIEKLSGKSWQDFIQERIFDPLKMTRTCPMQNCIKDKNKVKPHAEYENTLKVIDYIKDDEVGPAGSVWSTIDDISKWMACMINGSQYAGGSLLRTETWTEMFKPHVIVPEDEFFPTIQLLKPNWTTYGLGWFQHDYKGCKINYHTGSFEGLTAIHAQLPDHKLAICAFGNFDRAELRHALVYKAFDLFALGGVSDWSKDFLELYTRLNTQQNQDQRKFESMRVTGTKPSMPLANYVGKYSDDLYGTLEIRLSENNLLIEINSYVRASLQHWHYNTFRGPFEKRWRGNAVANFTFDINGQIDKVTFDGMLFTKLNEMPKIADQSVTAR